MHGGTKYDYIRDLIQLIFRPSCNGFRCLYEYEKTALYSNYVFWAIV